jgi:hypothetical protein
MAHDVKQWAHKVKQAAIRWVRCDQRIRLGGTPNQRIAARVKALRSE